MTEETPRLITFARNTLREFKDVGLPPGKVLDRTKFGATSDGKPIKTGLGVALQGLADFIALYRDELAWHGTDPLISRLEGGDRKPKISTLLADIAIASEHELDGKTAQLREALKVGNTDIIPALELAIRNIARDKSIQLGDNDLEFHNFEPENDQTSGRSKKGDAGTWRASLHDVTPGAPNISDQEIRQSAAQHDTDSLPIDQNAI